MVSLAVAVLCFQACLVQHSFLHAMVVDEERIEPILNPIESLSDIEDHDQCFDELLPVINNALGFGCGANACGPRDFAPTAWPHRHFTGYDIPYACYGREPFGFTILAERLDEPFAETLIDDYGGAGVGEVAVAGDLPSAGTTAVTGIVPIVGAIEFGGQVCASGSVTIAGACGCGCRGPFLF